MMLRKLAFHCSLLFVAVLVTATLAVGSGARLPPLGLRWLA